MFLSLRLITVHTKGKKNINGIQWQIATVEDFLFNRQENENGCLPLSARRRVEIGGGFEDELLPDCFPLPCSNNYSWLIMLVFKAGN